MWTTAVPIVGQWRHANISLAETFLQRDFFSLLICRSPDILNNKKVTTLSREDFSNFRRCKTTSKLLTLILNVSRKIQSTIEKDPSSCYSHENQPNSSHQSSTVYYCTPRTETGKIWSVLTCTLSKLSQVVLRSGTMSTQVANIFFPTIGHTLLNSNAQSIK